MIKKQLEKTLKDAIKEDAYIIGTKQVLGNISKSKLVLVSKSVPRHVTEKIEDDAKKSNISTIAFDDTSVNLGKLCGLQFRVSAISLTNIANADIKTLQKETESKIHCTKKTTSLTFSLHLSVGDCWRDFCVHSICT